MPKYAPKGYAYYSVVTPSVADEYLLPEDGPLKGRDARNWRRLKDIAELHATDVEMTYYERL